MFHQHIQLTCGYVNPWIHKQTKFLLLGTRKSYSATPPSIAQQQSYCEVCYIIIWCNRPLFFLGQEWPYDYSHTGAVHHYAGNLCCATTTDASTYWKCLVSTRWINITHSKNIDGCCTPIFRHLYNFEKSWHSMAS